MGAIGEVFWNRTAPHKRYRKQFIFARRWIALPGKSWNMRTLHNHQRTLLTHFEQHKESINGDVLEGTPVAGRRCLCG